MKIIELCGPPCAGKTYIKNSIIKNNIKISNSDFLIYDTAHFFIDLNYIEKISLKYFKYIKMFNRKNKVIKKHTRNIIIKNFKISSKKKIKNFPNLFLSYYRNVCKKIFYLYKKENPSFVKYVFKLIKQIKDKKQKKKIKEWYIEIFAKFYIAKNLNNKKTIIFDEGIVQRSLFLINFNGNLEKRLKKYITLSDKSNFLVFIDNKISNLIKRSKKRSFLSSDQFSYKSTSEVKKYKRFFKAYFKILKKI